MSKTIKQILELTKNPHYIFSDEDLEIIAQETLEEPSRLKTNKNRFKKSTGKFEKTFEENEE